MALLYRSNAQSRILEHSLFRAGVAYRVYGGLRFFERQEVKHALAYLRLAANPDDDTAFSRVVNFPPRGIGARSVEQLQEAAERGMGSLMHVARSGIVTGRSGTAHRAVHRDRSTGCASRPQTLALPELIEEVLDKSRLKDHYAAEKDGQDRLENLNELVQRRGALRGGFRARPRARGRGRRRTWPPRGHARAADPRRRSCRTRAWRRASARPRRDRTRCSS